MLHRSPPGTCAHLPAANEGDGSRHELPASQTGYLDGREGGAAYRDGSCEGQCDGGIHNPDGTDGNHRGGEKQTGGREERQDQPGFCSHGSRRTDQQQMAAPAHPRGLQEDGHDPSGQDLPFGGRFRQNAEKGLHAVPGVHELHHSGQPFLQKLFDEKGYRKALAELEDEYFQAWKHEVIAKERWIDWSDKANARFALFNYKMERNRQAIAGYNSILEHLPAYWLRREMDGRYIPSNGGSSPTATTGSAQKASLRKTPPR